MCQGDLSKNKKVSKEAVRKLLEFPSLTLSGVIAVERERAVSKSCTYLEVEVARLDNVLHVVANRRKGITTHA